MLSKYGRPTLICFPFTASTMSGKTVPISTVKVKSTKSRLLTRNIPSRLTAPSMRPSASSESMRAASSATHASSVTARKTRIVGPMELCVNE
jgi:hypothetical protein